MTNTNTESLTSMTVKLSHVHAVMYDLYMYSSTILGTSVHGRTKLNFLDVPQLTTQTSIWH